MIIGGIHHPYSCYEMIIDGLDAGEARFLYIGDANGNNTVLVVASPVSEGTAKIEVEVLGTRISVSQTTSNKVLICFSGSCLNNSDYIYVYEQK